MTASQLARRFRDLQRRFPMFFPSAPTVHAARTIAEALVENRRVAARGSYCAANTGNCVFAPDGAICACWESVGKACSRLGGPRCVPLLALLAWRRTVARLTAIPPGDVLPVAARQHFARYRGELERQAARATCDAPTDSVNRADIAERDALRFRLLELHVLCRMAGCAAANDVDRHKTGRLRIEDLDRQRRDPVQRKLTCLLDRLLASGDRHSRRIAYTVTHLVFYLGDFFARPLALPARLQRSLRAYPAHQLGHVVGEAEIDLAEELRVYLFAVDAARSRGRLSVRTCERNSERVSKGRDGIASPPVLLRERIHHHVARCRDAGHPLDAGLYRRWVANEARTGRDVASRYHPILVAAMGQLAADSTASRRLSG